MTVSSRFVTACGLGWMLLPGCVNSQAVGGVDEAGTEQASMDDSGGDSSGPGASDGAPLGLCPDNPDSCEAPCGAGDACGGPLSLYDEDGCLRPRCDQTGSCAEGRTCVRLGDYGSCAPTMVTCDDSDGTCSCGGPKDCSEDASICLPDALLPELQELVPTVEEFAQMCAAAQNDGACGGVPSFYDAEEDLAMWCRWRSWVPVTLGAADACEFGEPVQECGITTASEAGCGDDFSSCETGSDALARTNEAGQLEVSVASACGGQQGDAYCVFSEGELVDGDPACICLCDDAFPS